MQFWGQIIVQGVAVGAAVTTCVGLAFILLLPVTAIRIWKDTNAVNQKPTDVSVADNEEIASRPRFQFKS